MSFVIYTSFDRALPMVEAVNNAKTETQHREAQLRLEGYKKRCEEHGESWPCCQLDEHFDDGSDRPMCCGIYLDWEPPHD